MGRWPSARHSAFGAMSLASFACNPPGLRRRCPPTGSTVGVHPMQRCCRRRCGATGVRKGHRATRRSQEKRIWEAMAAGSDGLQSHCTRNLLASKNDGLQPTTDPLILCKYSKARRSHHHERLQACAPRAFPEQCATRTPVDSSWVWPGRNWCWVATKRHACYGHHTWEEAAEVAEKEMEVVKATEAGSATRTAEHHGAKGC